MLWSKVGTLFEKAIKRLEQEDKIKVPGEVEIKLLGAELHGKCMGIEWYICYCLEAIIGNRIRFYIFVLSCTTSALCL